MVQLISVLDAAVRFLHCCLSGAMSFSVIRCLPAVFHALLHLLVVDLLQHSTSIFRSVVLLLDLSRFDSTGVGPNIVCRPSSVTYAQTILITSV